ncbi:phospholipid-binding lipoprotein MlaA [Marinobacter daqiaonensis]|uniref:Phospholipid-binding lipoprotein MlaA n=1 Tax=Marinobacter daqiaonensis TaxID=650891 RepID=A0A1I6GX93_9GAMM|nr:VacJ family lipoprotein [Marinobacter daqiaonensis]SFR46691.1 phospholipid-binding lipoprotein MlaA [Marinobacter daqiaonensis]
MDRTSGFALAVLTSLIFISGCATSPDSEEASNQDTAVESGSTASSITDPYENWNRKVFAFNQGFDDYVLRPAAVGYQTVVPGFADVAVTNFFENLEEVRNFINSVLQLKGEHAVVAAGRFTYNTVFGLGGLIDVATAFDLPKRPEDFGQTLGYWGLGSGPYLMLPFLGPSTPRHLTGRATDGLVFPSPYDYAESPDRYYALVLEVVDKRADLISAEGMLSGDSYVFVRNAYLQRREFLVNDGRTGKDPFLQQGNEDVMLDNF